MPFISVEIMKMEIRALLLLGLATQFIVVIFIPFRLKLAETLQNWPLAEQNASNGTKCPPRTGTIKISHLDMFYIMYYI